MAATVTEKMTTGRMTEGERPGLTLEYIVRGVATYSEVIAALAATAPLTVGVMDRLNITAEPQYVDANTPDACVWDGSAEYGRKDQNSDPAPPETGDSSFSFDTSGGTAHITHSLETISNVTWSHETFGTYPADDFAGAIGVTRSGVEGVDKTIPVYSFSETHYIADANVTAAYKGKLFAGTGTVNNASFKGCAAGECLFLGASGQKRNSGDWEITFRFAAMPNKTNILVAEDPDNEGWKIIVPAKKGWEYLWVDYIEVDDQDSNCVVTRPMSAHVEKIYEESDFSQLGIGT